MSQVDRTEGLVGNTAFKSPVYVATTENITLSGEQTIDGFATSGSRVLVKDQTDPTENGIWVSDSGSWNRSQDFDGPLDFVQNTLVGVQVGSVNGNAIFRQATADPITIGSSNITFVVMNLPTIPLPPASGGTGGTTLPEAQENLGIVPVTGQCVLRYNNPETLDLLPRNGLRLIIEDTPRIQYFGGSNLDTSGLAADTEYNIYAYWFPVDDSGAVLMEASLTAHTLDNDTGLEVKSGDRTRAFLGTALTIDDGGVKWSPTGVYSWFNSPYGVVSQADQEAATSLELAVTPGRQHSHPSAAKAWCVATVAGVISTSFNMTSVTDGGVGQVTFTIATDFSSANWAGLALGLGGNGGASATTFVTVGVAQAAGSLGVTMVKLDDYQVADPTNWRFIGFGDQ